MVRVLQPAELHSHLGYWMRIVSNAVSHSFARKLEAEGVTVAEWVFLRMLHDHEAIAPTLLAERMGMTKGAISKLTDRLIEKNLVERLISSEDKRRQSLTLQPIARELVPRLASLADQNDSEFFGRLTRDERGLLKMVLRKIVSEQNLTNIPTD